MSRNYDENPLILQDDFYRISVGCAFLLGINLSMIFLIFFSGMVDWQSGSFWEVFRAEAMRDGRFVSMFIGVIFWKCFSRRRPSQKAQKSLASLPLRG